MCRRWRSAWLRASPTRSARCRSSWLRSRRRCLPGTARASCRSAWRRSPALASSSATALAASVSRAGAFRSGREFAASLGLTPLQNSSGGKERMGRIRKMGDRYLRRLLVVGMTSLVRRARTEPELGRSAHRRRCSQRKPARVVTVAAANRTARVAWAIMARGGTYRKPAAAIA